MHDAFVREHELQLKAAGLLEEEKMVNDCGRPIREQEILVSVLACHYPMEEMEQIISRYDDKTDPHLCFFVKTGYQYEEGLEWLECLRELVTRVSNWVGNEQVPTTKCLLPQDTLASPIKTEVRSHYHSVPLSRANSFGQAAGGTSLLST